MFTKAGHLFMKEDHLKMQKIINMEYNVYLKEGIRGLDTPMTTFAFVPQQGRDGKDGKPGLTGMKGSRGDTGTRGSEGIAGISGPRVCSFVIKKQSSSTLLYIISGNIQ